MNLQESSQGAAATTAKSQVNTAEHQAAHASDQAVAEASGQAPAQVTPSAIATSTRVPSKRLDYLDATRAIAIIGMLITHLVPLTKISPTVDYLASGRAAITFAVLAGISATLMVRAVNRRVGIDDPFAVTKAASWSMTKRALALFILGLFLPLVSLGPMVILCTYAVLLMVALPLMRIRSVPMLIALTGISAIVLPLVSFWLRGSVLPPTNVAGITPNILALTSGDEFVLAVRGLLVDGEYPIITWIPFVIAGIALGRVLINAAARKSAGSADNADNADIADSAAAGRVGVQGPKFGAIFAFGAVLSAFAYGVHVAVMQFSSLRDDFYNSFLEVMPELKDLPPEQLAAMMPNPFASSMGTTAVSDWRHLLLAVPHSGSPVEILGGIGVVCMLIPVVAWACNAGRVLPAVMRWFADLGRGALTYYVAHIVGVSALTLWVMQSMENGNAAGAGAGADAGAAVDAGAGAAGGLGGAATLFTGWAEVAIFVGFIVLPMVIAHFWFKKFKRGPLEAVMHKIAQ